MLKWLANKAAREQRFLISNPDVVTLAKQYVQEIIETAETGRICKCLWRIHPDDVEVKPNCCRECGVHSNKHDTPASPDFTHNFKGLRRHRLDEHPLCPVHTKEGLLVGFVQWVDKQK